MNEHGESDRVIIYIHQVIILTRRSEQIWHEACGSWQLNDEGIPLPVFGINIQCEVN